MVVIPTPNGTAGICADMKPLNESVRRLHHQLPTVDETLGQVDGANIFTKLDANSGFWQISLDLDSQLLPTGITPAGWYCFTKLSLGIASATETFQQRMATILQWLDRVQWQMDDILVDGHSQEVHDQYFFYIFYNYLYFYKNPFSTSIMRANGVTKP